METFLTSFGKRTNRCLSEKWKIRWRVLLGKRRLADICFVESHGRYKFRGDTGSRNGSCHAHRAFQIATVILQGLHNVRRRGCQHFFEQVVSNELENHLQKTNKLYFFTTKLKVMFKQFSVRLLVSTLNWNFTRK